MRARAFCAAIFIGGVLSRVAAVAAPSDLPNARLTPGAVATTDGATVCRWGYAHTVRPRGEAWRRLREVVYTRYGIPHGHRSSVDATGRRRPLYAIDHLIPLELGGAPADPRNLWPQLRIASEQKDRVENALHALVCGHRLPLRAAQQRIARDWRTAVPQ